METNNKAIEDLKLFLKDDSIPISDWVIKRKEMECRVYDYQGKSDVVRQKYFNKQLTLHEATEELDKIEEEAYKAIPDAEHDGDITYTVASIVSEIFDHQKLMGVKKADPSRP